MTSKATERYRVAGPFEVAGVAPGGVVELDPAAVNITALADAGHLQPTSKPAASTSKARDRS